MINVAKLHKEATARGVCYLFSGNETADEVIRLFSTTRGLEFVKKSNWPTLAQIRDFKAIDADRFGVYIDAGDIELHNPQRVLLIGDTRAEIILDDDAEFRHNITVLYGASVKILASNAAVVFAEKNIGGGCIELIKEDNSIVYVG